MFTDLTPNVALLCATKADRDGNLFTGPNTEDTPTIAEATAFRDGVVLVQADEIVDIGELPRVDIPGRLGRSRRRGRPAVRARAAVHPRSAVDRAGRDSQGDDRHPRRVRTTRGDVAQPWDRIRHGGNRIASPDVRRAAGFEGQDRQALDAEPASDADTGDRIGVGGIDPQLRRRSRDGALHRGPARRVLHRTGRIAAIQPGVVSACRPVRGRHVHRVFAADRSATPTRRPSPTAGCPGSAAPRTWATTRTVAGTRPPHG